MYFWVALSGPILVWSCSKWTVHTREVRLKFREGIRNLSWLPRVGMHPYARAQTGCQVSDEKYVLFSQTRLAYGFLLLFLCFVFVIEEESLFIYLWFSFPLWHGLWFTFLRSSEHLLLNELLATQKPPGLVELGSFLFAAGRKQLFQLSKVDMFLFNSICWP